MAIKLLLLLNLLIANSFANNKACDLWQDLPSKRLEEVNKYQKEIFKNISNTRVFYKVSDQLLSKASTESFKSKKDFLTKWAASSELSPDKQSDIILEWREQFLMGVLLPSYRQLSSTQKSVLDQAFKDLHDFTFPEEIKRSYEDIFEQAKMLSYSLIDSQKFPKEVNMILKGNIARIKINWIDSIKGSQFIENPLKYFETGILFNPKYHILTIGQLASKYTDGDTILSVMIQQIAQSISPCRWSILYGNRKYPYAKVVECLQSPKSIYAKSRDDSKINQYLKEKKITQEQKNALLKYPSCNTPFYPTNGIQHDQTNIAFTDWFSSEAISQFSKLSPKFREDLCSIGSATTLQAYPPNFERLVRIYFANEKIRSLVKVSIGNNIKYCKFQK
ncbi:hypothetical protein [Halobacteriovorax marinus]|uniref:hypothetical protein n=1 Tax=Halobacteriovorax marinus TaxID=97084 RepID=UPI003A8FFC92